MAAMWPRTYWTLCVINLKSWDHPGCRRAHSAESSVEKIPLDCGLQTGVCLVLFYPHYLAHSLTRDRNSIYTPHSFTKGRKGRREKGNEAHLSSYTLDFVASYWWSSMVTSIFNFTSCWHLLNITVYSWLILYHHMPESPIEVWIGSYSVCPKYNFVTTGASVFCNYAPGLWNLFPVEIKRGASVVEIRLKQRRYMYLLISLIFAVVLIWFSFDFLYSLYQYLTKW